ncbi:MAG: nicotinamide-nucleotide amidohydrolase family protein [Clostridia bacterium]|nr:nicotinamide-nucleotide amidohydrolase family protein [Clostridia bacterium]
MKALILTVNENILNGLEPNEVGSVLSRLLFTKGVEIESEIVVSNSKDSLQSALNNLNADVNTIIVLGDFDTTKNLEIKKLISDYLGDSLEINAFSEETVKNYYKNSNLPLVTASLNEALIPKSANPIENTSSYHQGFATYANGKHIIFLPMELNAVKDIYNNWFIDYIEAKFSKLYLTKTFKTFGLSKIEALKLLDDLLKNKNLIKLLIYEHDLELVFVVKYSPLSPKEDVNAYIKNMCERLKNFIYAYDDSSLYKKAFELLKLQGNRIAIAESITGGNIVANLIKNNEGIGNYLVEGITCYSNNSKIARLNVQPHIIDKYSSVSAEVAYELAAGLLQTCEEADLVLATVGYASGAGEKNGLVYIAVGDLQGIHIYKNIFSGSRQKIIDLATNSALFYLIKKIKQNDINLEQMFDNR